MSDIASAIAKTADPLPVLTIVKTSLQPLLTASGLMSIARRGWVYGLALLFMGITQLDAGLAQRIYDWRLPIVIGLSAYGISSFAITEHILVSSGREVSPLVFKATHPQYIWRLLLIGLICALPFVLAVLVALGVVFGAARDGSFVVYGLGGPLALLLFSRLILALPAIALNQGGSLKAAWLQSAGNTLRIALGIGLMLCPFIGIFLVIEFLSSLKFLNIIGIIGLLRILTEVLAVAALSNFVSRSYAELQMPRPVSKS